MASHNRIICVTAVNVPLSPCTQTIIMIIYNFHLCFSILVNEIESNDVKAAVNSLCKHHEMMDFASVSVVKSEKKIEPTNRLRFLPILDFTVCYYFIEYGASFSMKFIQIVTYPHLSILKRKCHGIENVCSYRIVVIHFVGN